MWSSLLVSVLSSAPAPDLSAALDGYAEVLEHHVREGRVDYEGIEKERLEELDRFLAAVARAELPSDRSARIGFLVDAYNALVARSVIRHGLPESVLDVSGFFKGEKHRVAGRDLTLDELEKEVLNPYASDPRTHFVLVCAAVGCPRLETKPFFGSDVDARMEAAARRYLASRHGARVRGETLALSKIFEWYAKDFGGPEGVLRFVRPRLPDSLRARLPPVPKITYFEYDWALNRR